MLKFIKKYYQYLLCAAIVLIVMGFLSVIKHYWPFGEVSMLSGDFLGQSFMFFSELKEKLLTHDSLANTWNIGYGSNFWSVIYFGHINPYTLLFMLVPYRYWTQLSMITYTSSLMFMSFSMLYYLRHRPYKRLDENHPIHILFALSYAFCAYCISYANIWYFMVCAIFFPLIILGLENFVSGKGWKLYFFTLLIAFISNYYLAGLFCVFIILYYLTLEFKSFKSFLATSGRILLLSLVSIGVSGVVLVPTIMQMMGHSYTFSERYPGIFYTSFFDILKQYLSFNTGFGMGSEGENYGEVNLYYGLLPLLLTILYFLMSKIPLKSKIKKLIVFVLYLLAFNTDGLNYVMHLFHYPTYYPNRFAIFFTLYSIILAYECWVEVVESEYKELKMSKVVPVGFGWVILTVVIFAFAKSIDYQFTYYYSIMAFMVYMILLLITSRIKKLEHVLIGIACVGIGINAVLTGIFRDADYIWVNLADNKERAETLMNEAQLEEAHGFSRMLTAHDNWNGSNTGMLYDSKNPTLFASALGDTGHMLDAAGIYSSANTIQNYTYTPATLGLLGVQYIYSDFTFEYWEGNDNSYTSANHIYTGYPVVKEESGVSIQEVERVLSLGYRIPEESSEQILAAIKSYDESKATPGMGINAWVKAVAGGDDVMQEVDPKVIAMEAKNCYTGYKKGTLYVSAIPDENTLETITKDSVISDVSMEEYNFYDDSYIRVEFEASEDGFYYVDNPTTLAGAGYVKKGDTFSYFYQMKAADIQQQGYGTIGIHVYRFDDAAWEKAYEKLSKEQLEVTEYDSGHVTGTVTMEEAGLLFTSISYDDNWHVYVDGAEVEPVDLWNHAFVGVQVPEGTHEIRFVYKQRGIGIGFAVSVLSILCCLLFFFKQDIIMKENQH